MLYTRLCANGFTLRISFNPHSPFVRHYENHSYEKTGKLKFREVKLPKVTQPENGGAGIRAQAV